MRTTAAQRAARLFQHACRGPCFDDNQTRELYRIWSTTWLIPDLVNLVPQLKGTKPPTITTTPDPFWKEHPVEPLLASCNQGAKLEWTYCPYCGAQARKNKRKRVA